MAAVVTRVACFFLVPLALSGAGAASRVAAAQDDDADASAGLVVNAPSSAVQAAFASRSYRPGATAVLRLRGRAAGLRVGLYRAGSGPEGPLHGSPVGSSRDLRGTADHVSLRLGGWPSGLYYARVVTPGRGIWYAPFVLRPGRLGMSRVLVVLPTNTWQAYNFEDRDSWYADAEVHTVDLARPYVDRGVPPHFDGYDDGFLRWLDKNDHETDFLSDDDLDRVASGGELARAYDLIVFSGHEEYVTGHEYDVIQRYRDLGGNLAFLSANSFFYKVVKRGSLMDGRWHWRDSRPSESALVGGAYVDWYHGRYPNRPFRVTGAGNAPWFFNGSGLRDGDSFGVYGIEIDARTNASPPGTRVLARIDSIFGPGESAEMTYYTTPRGAKVFDAGVMNFGGSALWPEVSPLMENLWSHLTVP